MKALLSVILFLFIATFSQAQVCNQYLVSHVNDTINFQPVSYSLTYNSNGLLASRINYVPGTNDVKFTQNYYYTGNRLDSLIGYESNSKIGQIFTYNSFGNLSGILNINPYPQGNKISTFLYQNNQLTDIYIQDLELSCSNIITDGYSIKTGSIRISPYGGKPYNEPCTFIYNTLPNPLYNKIGIVNNPLLYLTPNTFLGLKVTGSNPYNSQNVKYHTNPNLISSIRYNIGFTDALQSQDIGYSYDCASFLTNIIPVLSPVETLSISPNPSSIGLYKINVENAKMKVYTADGQLILESSNSLADLSSHQAGIYLLHVDLPEGKKVMKLVKN